MAESKNSGGSTSSNSGGGGGGSSSGSGGGTATNNTTEEKGQEATGTGGSSVAGSSNSNSTETSSNNATSSIIGTGTCDATDTEREWAQAAHTEFSKGNYTAAFALLAQLHSTRPKDHKVVMNKAVVEYYKGDLKKTDTFRKQLADICAQSGVKIEDVGVGGEEGERSVVQFNHCILLYHLHQYRAALTILEKMYTGLESLEESVGIGVCLLMAECHLGAHHPERALPVIAHTETTFLPQPLPHTPSHKQPPPPHDKENKSPEKSSVSGGMGSNSSSSSSSSSSISSSSSSSSSAATEEIRCSATQEQLRGRLQQLRVRALLMIRALRLAKKELKTIVTHAVNAGNSLNVTLISLKSQLEHLRGNHRKAIKVLNQCAAIPPPNPCYGPSLGVMYYNNLGVIHMGLGKPTLACLYLQKALKEAQAGEQQYSGNSSDLLSQRPLYQLSSNVQMELYYNLGVTLLHMNKPEKAFDFLLEVVQVHSMNPRLWLRLAECCIAVHKAGVREDLSNKRAIVQGTVGVGLHRKICLATRIADHNKKLCDPHSESDAAFPEPTLEFGRLCLRNALALLQDDASTTPLTDEQEASGVLPELYPGGPSSPLRGSEVVSLRVSALAATAYVTLCLSDFPAALRHSELLLTAHPKTPAIYKLLGHLYAGEALICLGKVSEAIAHLDPRLVGDLTVSPPTPDSAHTPPPHTPPHNQAGYPHTPASAMLVMRYNLSVAYTLRREWEKANNLLKEVWTESNGNMPAQVIMLAMYIQLQMGNVDVMKNIVKKNILLT